MKKVTFSELKKVVENLRYPDSQHFRGTALAKLHQAYDPYPTAFANEKFCFLLSKGLLPKEAAALEENVASKRVVVLRNEGQAWKRIWPDIGVNTAPEAVTKVAPQAAPQEDPDIIWEED